jgi:hypothetical protein
LVYLLPSVGFIVLAFVIPSTGRLWVVGLGVVLSVFWVGLPYWSTVEVTPVDVRASGRSFRRTAVPRERIHAMHWNSMYLTAGNVKDQPLADIVGGPRMAEITAMIPPVAPCNPNDSDCRPNAEACYPAYCNPDSGPWEATIGGDGNQAPPPTQRSSTPPGIVP